MKRMTQQQPLKWWLVVMVASLTSIVQAEDVTVTTYYPSPRGNYQTLSTTGNTSLATDPAGSVVIGVTSAPALKLDVRGRLRINDGTVNPNGKVLSALNAQGDVGWTALGSMGFVIGPGTPPFIPLWNTATGLGDSVIQQNSLNIGIGAAPAAGFKLDVSGAGRFSNALTAQTLTLTGLTCPTGELYLNASGTVSCRSPGDTIFGNEYTTISGVGGITVTGSPPSATVALATPVKSCNVAGQFMRSFDLSAAGPAATCADPPGGAGGSVKSLENISMAGVGNVDLIGQGGISITAGVNTITISGAAGGLPPGSLHQTLRHDGNNTWAANSNLINTGSLVGVGMPPGYKLDVAGDINLGGTNVYRRGGTPGVSANCPVGNTPSGLTVAGGIVTAAGACAAIGGSGSLPAGSSGQTLRHDGAQWVANSLLYNNGTSIGIGTSSPHPNARLHIGGTNQRMYLGTGGYFVINRGQGVGDIYFGEAGESGTWRFRGDGGLTVNDAQVCRANTTIPGCPTTSGNANTGRLWQDSGITLTPNPWDPDSGVDATISAASGPSGSVKSLEGIAMSGTGNVDLVPGSNVTIAAGPGDAITISATTSSGPPGSGVTGSGTPNYVPKWTSTANPGNLANSSISENGGNVFLGGTNQRMYLGTGGYFVINRGPGVGDIYFGENSDGGIWRFRGQGGLTVNESQVCRQDGTGCPMPAWTTVTSGMFTDSAPHSVRCPNGYIATGGGTRIANKGAFALDLYSSHPDSADPQLWHCWVMGSGSAWFCDARCLRFPD